MPLFHKAPDTWLSLLTKFHTTTDALLFHFALRVCRTGSLAQGFTRQEFIKAVRPLGCNVSERTIYKVFQDVIEHDNHPLLAKIDPSWGSGSKNCKFRLRSLEDIKRRANILRIAADSQRHAKVQARELGAKIMSVEADGVHLPYDAAMDIPAGSIMTLQPTAKHEIVSDEKQIIKAPPAKPRLTSPEETTTARADNMGRPGNWHKPSWDPQFIYWELVKACCLLHGYEVRDDVGIFDPQTGEVW